MQKVIRTGNSLAVTVPAHFVRSVGIRIGDNVQVRLEPDSGKAVYSFFGAKQLPLPGEIISRRKRRKVKRTPRKPSKLDKLN